MPNILHSTTLLLIRHGDAQPVAGSYDENTPLSELGLAQAAKTADYLLWNSTPTVVYSSPFLRALETSKPYCQQFGLKTNIDPRLSEFEMATQQVDETEAEFWLPEHRGRKDGETLSEFSTRVWAACDEIVEHHYGMQVAIFAHSGTIDAAIRWALGIPPESPWQYEFAVANASITEITFWPRGRVHDGSPRYAHLSRLGYTGHLGDRSSEL